MWSPDSWSMVGDHRCYHYVLWRSLIQLAPLIYPMTSQWVMALLWTPIVMSQWAMMLWASICHNMQWCYGHPYVTMGNDGMGIHMSQWAMMLWASIRHNWAMMLWASPVCLLVGNQYMQISRWWATICHNKHWCCNWRPLSMTSQYKIELQWTLFIMFNLAQLQDCVYSKTFIFI